MRRGSRGTNSRFVHEHTIDLNVKSVEIGRICPSFPPYSSSHWVSSQADVARAPPFLSVARHAPSLSFSARYTHTRERTPGGKNRVSRSLASLSFLFFPSLFSLRDPTLFRESARACDLSPRRRRDSYTPPRAHNHHQPQTTTTTTQLYARRLSKNPISPDRDRSSSRSSSRSGTAAAPRHAGRSDHQGLPPVRFPRARPRATNQRRCATMRIHGSSRRQGMKRGTAITLPSRR